MLVLIKMIIARILQCNLDIIAFTDNSFVVKMINKEELILCDAIQDTIGIIIQIRAEIKKSLLQIRIEYSNGKLKRNERFEDNPGPFFIRKCNKEATGVREENHTNEVITNLPEYGIAILLYWDIPQHKAITEVIWIYDTKQEEYHMAFRKYKEKTKYLDLDLRVIIYKIAMNSVIKYCSSFNHYTT